MRTRRTATTRRGFLRGAVGVGALGTLAGCLTGEPAPLVVGATTTTHDTGLLDALHGAFARETGITVHPVVKGTGAIVRTARDGDLDALLVHARPLEEALVADGVCAGRQDVMFNDFVLVGPPADPAEIGELDDAPAALARIAATDARFLSRGDGSGTHLAERRLWTASGVTPSGAWYRETGQGQGATLVAAGEQRAYALTDRGTYLATRHRLPLAVHVEGPVTEGAPSLKNQYGALAVSPNRFGHVEDDAARAYVAFLTGPAGQALIDAYRVDGHRLFVPNA